MKFKDGWMIGWMDESWGGMALNLVQGPALNFSSVFNEKVPQIYIYIYIHEEIILL